MHKSIMALLLVIFLYPSVAFSFQKESVKQSDSVQTSPTKENQLDLRKADSFTAGDKPNIEINIPGIGKLGELPKIDFGLELLYGKDEPKIDEAQETPDDVTIRGSVKHRF
ncbi:MAG: hypothetical protein AAF228_04885 [Pseudomonadota bacterium]